MAGYIEVQQLSQMRDNSVKNTILENESFDSSAADYGWFGVCYDGLMLKEGESYCKSAINAGYKVLVVEVYPGTGKQDSHSRMFQAYIKDGKTYISMDEYDKMLDFICG